MKEEFLRWLNGLSHPESVEQFRRCCGAESWCQSMAACRPFSSFASLHDNADQVFDKLVAKDWLEAFAAHPPLGQLHSSQLKQEGNQEWSAKEQSGVAAADQATLVSLAEANRAYRDKFGYTFILCATGKSADQMLDSLRRRLQNHPDEELEQAAGEQRLITHLRLEKIVWPPA